MIDQFCIVFTRKVKRIFKIESSDNFNSVNRKLIMIAASPATLLTMLTFFSTAILEKIFGNGAVEVSDH